MTQTVTLTVSLAHIIYMAGVLGFIAGVLALWVTAELISKFRKIRAARQERRRGGPKGHGRHHRRARHFGPAVNDTVRYGLHRMSLAYPLLT